MEFFINWNVLCMSRVLDCNLILYKFGHSKSVCNPGISGGLGKWKKKVTWQSFFLIRSCLRFCKNNNFEPVWREIQNSKNRNEFCSLVQSKNLHESHRQFPGSVWTPDALSINFECNITKSLWIPYLYRKLTLHYLLLDISRTRTGNKVAPTKRPDTDRSETLRVELIPGCTKNYLRVIYFSNTF